MNTKRLTAQFEFDQDGLLQAILFNVGSDRDESILKNAISRLMLPVLRHQVLDPSSSQGKDDA
jgi:hypothetical protein